MLSRKRVLVVEDEFLQTMFLNNSLLQLGFDEVHTASSVVMGSQIMSEQDFDIGFFDVNLRGQSGVPLAERFHAKGGRVVFISAHQVAPDVISKLGAIYMPKPISYSALSKCLMKLDEVDDMLMGKMSRDVA